MPMSKIKTAQYAGRGCAAAASVYLSYGDGWDWAQIPKGKGFDGSLEGNGLLAGLSVIATCLVKDLYRDLRKCYRQRAQNGATERALASGMFPSDSGHDPLLQGQQVDVERGGRPGPGLGSGSGDES